MEVNEFLDLILWDSSLSHLLDDLRIQRGGGHRILTRAMLVMRKMEILSIVSSEGSTHKGMINKVSEV
jgi:hypothetical protein